jgi:hypothetical protein
LFHVFRLRCGEPLQSASGRVEPRSLPGEDYGKYGDAYRGQGVYGSAVLIEKLTDLERRRQDPRDIFGGPAQGNVAAVSVETDGGKGASADSAIVIVSRRTPSPGPPSALVSFAISGSPAIQPAKKEITALSPGRTRAHPGPIA